MAKFAILAVILILTGWQYEIHWFLFGGVLLGAGCWLWWKEHSIDESEEEE